MGAKKKNTNPLRNVLQNAPSRTRLVMIGAAVLRLAGLSRA